LPVERPQSQFRQVARLLREAIEDGEYAPGAMLPPEPELAERYGVSRSTVNNAVTILRTWGLVRVKRGVGTMVREIPAIHRNATARYQRAARERAGARGAFDSEVRSLGLEPRSDQEISTIPAPADVAQALQIDEGVPVVRRMRHMFANDVPVQIAPSYIPGDIAEGTALAEADSGPGGIVSRFAELGHEQVRITESVRVRPASDDEERFLQLDEAEQVIEIRHIGWDAAGRPVELAVHVARASLWVLEYEWPIS
jgi:GntR family transcriptional regulator